MNFLNFFRITPAILKKTYLKDDADSLHKLLYLLRKTYEYMQWYLIAIDAIQSNTARKMSKYGVFSGPYFSVSGPEKTTYLGTFHAVKVIYLLPLNSKRKRGSGGAKIYLFN